MQDPGLPPGVTHALIDRAYGRQLSCHEQDACARHKVIQVYISVLFDALKKHDHNDHYIDLLCALEDARMNDDKIVDLVIQNSEDAAAFRSDDSYDRWGEQEEHTDALPQFISNFRKETP
jgi:hypothetical protein